ncbi:MAG: OadG family protein [Candidatus Muirbacterium halophilum]|nr:OadG family protein [Candidatus Muirbacterium halophilum]MCK9475390.1 OadG family protein [Candidatus Muirbacterium halophilum]
MDIFYFGLKVSTVGMSIVFSILIIISIFIYFLRFFQDIEQETIIEDIIELKKENIDDSDEIAAVISAVVASFYKDCKFRINSFTEVTEEIANSNFKDFNIWAKYGRMDIMTNHSNFGKGRLEKWKR